MNETEVIGWIRESLWVMLKIAGPLLLIALLVGVVISLFQALTQIQEATLTFVPKIILMMAAVVLLLPFIVQSLQSFTTEIAARIVAVGQEDSSATAP